MEQETYTFYVSSQTDDVGVTIFSAYIVEMMPYGRLSAYGDTPYQAIAALCDKLGEVMEYEEPEKEG
jgi:hypothetical protein